MKFEEKIRNSIETECEDYFLGTVDLSRVENSIIGKYESLIAEYPRAISVGVTLPNLVSGELQKSVDALYKETNCIIKNITSHLSSLFEKEGYRTFAMPKSKIMDDETNISIHEIVANLANLGSIEKNLLVTPEVGSRVNWGTVLTNAPL